MKNHKLENWEEKRLIKKPSKKRKTHRDRSDSEGPDQDNDYPGKHDEPRPRRHQDN